MPYGGGYRRLSSKNSRLNQCNFIKNSKKGAILIEFAFAVPVLFSLIYYVQDLSKLKRYNERMDFVAHQMAQILQNVSNNQSITKWHIRQAVAAAYLSFYPGKSLYTTSTSDAYGPFYGPGFAHGQIYYVTCNESGKASVKWRIQFQLGGSGTGNTPTLIGVAESNADDNRSSVRFKSNVSPAEIYPSLSMNPGEVKIIVDAFIYFNPNSGYKKVGGKTWGSAREEFGFHIVSPKPVRTKEFYFEKIVIFTPKPSLFSETPPQ